MLKIRLTRTGKKKQPNYRVVVANKDSKRDGRIVERIGHYNPLVNPAEYRIQEDRALYWLSVGAQPTDAVRRLLEKQGTMGRLQRYHAGEPMETLVAEYTGVSASDKAETAVVEEAILEAVAEEIAAEAVEEAMEEAAIEAIEEEIVAEAVEEAVAEAIEEEIVAEVVEEAIEEEIVAEVVEEAAAEAIEEEIVAEAVEEEVVEAVAEEEAEEAEEAEADDDAESEDE